MAGSGRLGSVGSVGWISVYQVSNSTFTNVTATTGNFFIEPGSFGDTFTSCVPTPTPH